MKYPIIPKPEPDVLSKFITDGQLPHPPKCIQLPPPSMISKSQYSVIHYWSMHMLGLCGVIKTINSLSDESKQYLIPAFRKHLEQIGLKHPNGNTVSTTFMRFLMQQIESPSKPCIFKNREEIEMKWAKLICPDIVFSLGGCGFRRLGYTALNNQIKPFGDYVVFVIEEVILEALRKVLIGDYEKLNMLDVINASMNSTEAAIKRFFGIGGINPVPQFTGLVSNHDELMHEIKNKQGPYLPYQLQYLRSKITGKRLAGRIVGAMCHFTN